MRIIITGGRNYKDWITFQRILDIFQLAYRNLILVNGGSGGADLFARMYASGFPFLVRTEMHLANWEECGKAAGPLRNQAMVDLGADLCIAFPGNRGTEDTIKRARKAGIVVLRVEP